MSVNMFQNERVWRMLANIWTFFVAAFLVFDFFSFNRYQYLTAIFSVIYAAVLSIYAGTKEFKRWYSHYEGRHFGGWFAIGWTVLIVFLVSAKFVLGDKYSISPEAVADYILVLSLFALTQRLKLAYARKKEEGNGIKIVKLLSNVRKLSKAAKERLRQYPIIYAIIGGIGIILFWRGIWHLADLVFPFFINNQSVAPLDYASFWDSLLSAVIGFILLLFTGLFVSDFVGSQIISTAVKTEKLVEETEKEVEETEKEEEMETKRLKEIESRFEEVTSHLDEHLEKIEKELNKK